ncbi:MAG: hypothetical protein KAS74_07650 [Methanosarcinales archaeon]|nr:hypothetical protein [Methanosarcinales archaeon]
MSEKFGFPVFTAGMLVIAGVVRLLEVNGMLWLRYTVDPAHCDHGGRSRNRSNNSWER